MEERFIKVGIKTFGEPKVIRHNDYTLVENMLIGDGFHWQTVINAKLPGEITLLKNTSNQEENFPGADKNISLINILSLEKYLECVVGSEMNPKAPLEFLKAHAVISRSWALGKMTRLHDSDNSGMINESHSLIGWDNTIDHSGFHVCSDDHCQRYQGLQSISPLALKAIHETEEEVLISSDGKLLDSRFSKCCGGMTELFSTCWQNLEMPCLKSFSDTWCNLSALSAHTKRTLLSAVLKDYDLATDNYGFSWNVEISKEEVKNNLKNRFGRNIGNILSLKPLHRGASGRIDLMRIQGTEDYLDLGKELWIRRLLSPSHLYSSAFDIKDKGNSFLLSGKGWGHGVGLCQIGAANMALKGYAYKEILSFYYPDSRLGKWDNNDKK